MRLGTKWTLALVAVCLVEAALVFAAVRIGTQRSFDRFIREQAMADFAERAAVYYRTTGTLEDIAQAFERRGRRSRRADSLRQRGRRFGDGLADSTRRTERQTRRDGEGRDADRRTPRLRFALADAEGVIRLAAGGYAVGDTLQADDPAERLPVVVDEDTVGVVLRTAETQTLGPAEQRFLTATRAALWWAVGLALLGAVLLGALLARAATRPLRRLTAATEALAQGALGETVPVESGDEIGHLSEAFNRMSARLAEAHALRRQMTADVAHDLRTPLAILSGTLEGLTDGTLAPTPERLATLRTEAEHLGRLVEDFRLLALADAGELALNRTPLDIRVLLDRVRAAFQPDADRAGVTLAVQSEADLPTVRADADRLYRVFGNLVQNALRHTPEGGSVALSAARYAGGLALMVEDTGEGIAPDLLPRIFERTVQGDTARTDVEASGLGLAIARSLVEAHGGTIEVRSTPGAGATFTVLLPTAAHLAGGR